MANLKQHEVKSEKEIGGNKFFIRAFPAFTAANISGEIAGVIAPAIAAIAPAAATNKDILEIDASTFSGALSGLSGDKVESILKKLLTKHGNISIEISGENKVTLLNDDIASEIFCGTVQDMFILAAEVINVNFGGFFEKLANQFGLRKAQETQNLTSRNMGD